MGDSGRESQTLMIFFAIPSDFFSVIVLSILQGAAQYVIFSQKSPYSNSDVKFVTSSQNRPYLSTLQRKREVASVFIASQLKIQTPMTNLIFSEVPNNFIFIL
jgi:hypothetical protein